MLDNAMVGWDSHIWHDDEVFGLDLPIRGGGGRTRKVLEAVIDHTPLIKRQRQCHLN